MSGYARGNRFLHIIEHAGMMPIGVGSKNKKQHHLSCEIVENFVETPICKLRAILRSRELRVAYVAPPTGLTLYEHVSARGVDVRELLRGPQPHILTVHSPGKKSTGRPQYIATCMPQDVE